MPVMGNPERMEEEAGTWRAVMEGLTAGFITAMLFDLNMAMVRVMEAALSFAGRQSRAQRWRVVFLVVFPAPAPEPTPPAHELADGGVLVGSGAAALMGDLAFAIIKLNATGVLADVYSFTQSS